MQTAPFKAQLLPRKKTSGPRVRISIDRGDWEAIQRGEKAPPSHETIRSEASELIGYVVNAALDWDTIPDLLPWEAEYLLSARYPLGQLIQQFKQ